MEMHGIFLRGKGYGMVAGGKDFAGAREERTQKTER